MSLHGSERVTGGMRVLVVGSEIVTGGINVFVVESEMVTGGGNGDSEDTLYDQGKERVTGG